MNAAQVKKIGIVEFLMAQGIEPEKQTHEGRKVIYLSPFRQENNASFHVDVQKNVWYDFGEGAGGNIIDLVMRMKDIDFPNALDVLNNQRVSVSFSFNQQKKIIKAEAVPAIELIEVKQVSHSSLRSYLLQRKIKLAQAIKYTKEVRYRIAGKQKTYFAIGFKNEKGGWELRNKYFKGGTSPKYHTLIRGKSNKKLNVFEGFFDFLSSLVLSKQVVPNFDSLVLNSVANIQKSKVVIVNYPELNLFLDNDNAGKKAATELQKYHRKVNDMSTVLYPNVNDLNDYLIEQIDNS